MGGAERVAEVLHQMYPESDLLSSLAVPERLSDYLREAEVRTTWMQKLPWKAKLFRHYFLLYPLAMETVDLYQYDLVITSCFGYAKGVKTRRSAVHICYCHTPMRWVWRGQDYFAREKVGPLKKLFLKCTLTPLGWWETKAARRPDYYIANSRAVATRLMDTFGVPSFVIPPPIETGRFKISADTQDYFLVLSRLVPYKRLDLAVQAATRLSVPLKVVGTGPDLDRLKSLAGPTVEFLGRQSDDAVNELASQCKALLFPGEEDFGMAPLEINAAGRPVIAFYGGGAVETIIEGLNGVFFWEPTVDSLCEALARFQAISWNPVAIQAHARTYDTAEFKSKVRAFISEALEQHTGAGGGERRAAA